MSPTWPDEVSCPISAPVSVFVGRHTTLHTLFYAYALSEYQRCMQLWVMLVSISVSLYEFDLLILKIRII
ncbi:unnamed protein product [Prunus brigantina]